MSDEIKKQFGQKVKYYRELRGLTQEALAERIDVNINSMSYIERGINFIKSDTLAKICSVLKITPKQLFDFDFSPLPQEDLKLLLHKLIDTNEDKLTGMYKILSGYLS